MRITATVAAGLFCSAVEAANFNVITLADSGVGSLRQVITALNAAPNEAHTVTFFVAPNTPMVLTSNLPLITQADVTLNGRGAVIDGAGEYRLFRSANNSFGRLRLQQLTLQNARATDSSAACVSVANTEIELEDVQMNNCNGGAIYTQLGLTALRSVFRDNAKSGFSPRGAAVNILAQGPVSLSLDRVDFINNSLTQQSGSNCGGSALHVNNLQSAVIRRTRALNNSALSETAASGCGAAIVLFGTQGARILLDGVAVHGNLSDGSSGVFVGFSAVNSNNRLDVQNSSFVANTSLATGAALSGNNVTVRLRNSTFWRNASSQSTDIRGFTGFTIAQLSNTLFGPTIAATPSCSGAVLDTGILGTLADFNLYAAASGYCGLNGIGSNNQLAIDPRLWRIAMVNGSPVAQAFQGASVDTGNPAATTLADSFDWTACAPTDQAAQLRPANGRGGPALSARCDIGAYEWQREAPLFADNFAPN